MVLIWEKKKKKEKKIPSTKSREVVQTQRMRSTNITENDSMPGIITPALQNRKIIVDTLSNPTKFII